METKARDFNGYQQYRYGRAWKFYICGFDSSTSGKAGLCRVLKSDGTKEQVPIDAKDQILINGAWYGRAHWHH